MSRRTITGQLWRIVTTRLRNRFMSWDRKVTTAILAILEEGGEFNGYRLRRLVQLAHPGLKVNEAIIYATLYALERDGKITGRWETPEDTSVPRKLYSIVRPDHENPG